MLNFVGLPRWLIERHHNTPEVALYKLMQTTEGQAALMKEGAHESGAHEAPPGVAMDGLNVEAAVRIALKDALYEVPALCADARMPWYLVVHAS